jgi:hypothetical protein
MSFTPSACYDLTTHTVNFNQSGVEVILNSTGVKVDGASYGSGFDIMVDHDEFCFGEIDFETSFDVAISLIEEDGGFDFNGTTYRIVGSDELEDPGVTKHVWALDQCPVRMTKNGTDVIVKCPCTTSGTPCTNECYSSK